VNALPPDERLSLQTSKMVRVAISIVLWGLASKAVEEEGTPPILGSDGKGLHANNGTNQNHGRGRGGEGGERRDDRHRQQQQQQQHHNQDRRRSDDRRGGDHYGIVDRNNYDGRDRRYNRDFHRGPPPPRDHDRDYRSGGGRY